MARSSPPAALAMRSPSAKEDAAAAWLNMVQSLHATVERPQEAPASVKRLRRVAPGEEQRPGPATVGGAHDVDLVFEPLAQERGGDPCAGEARRGGGNQPEDQDVTGLLDSLPPERQPLPGSVDDDEARPHV